MGRAPRAEFRGATYHVFSRGNRRERIFLDEEDYATYIAHLRETAQKLGVAVLAYCLMPNHPHLCLKTEDTPLSVFMQRINTRHAKRFNQKYSLRGHLHESRYRAILVDEATYLLTLVRYIHQNPLRAGLVSRLDEWKYSSYQAYLATGSWVRTRDVLRHFDGLASFESFMGLETSPEDAEVFSSAGRGFRFAGHARSVPGLVRAVEQCQKEKTLWLPLGQTRACSDDDLESIAETWMREQSAPVRLADVQGNSMQAPIRKVRRALAVFLRSRNYPLRSIALLLGRDTPSVSRLITRANQHRPHDNMESPAPGVLAEDFFDGDAGLGGKLSLDQCQRAEGQEPV